jgi:glycosyltransferase involved in cell wall biosynthesis
MDVLLATPNVVVGDGQGRVNLELASHLARRGHRVTLLASSIDENLRGEHGIEWQYLPLRMRLPALLRDVLWSRKATAWLVRNGPRYDIVHLNGASAYVPHHVNTCHFVHGSFRKQLAVASAPGSRGHYHRLYSEASFRAERRVYALARSVVAVSGKTRQELEEDVGVPPDRLHVIHNGVDTLVFRPDAEARARVRRELQISDETFALLFVGELIVPRKGLDTVLAAMHRLPDHFHLFVAGTGSAAAYREMLADIGDRVSFLGFRDDVPALYAAMDCFVYPTRYDACALSVLEALAVGMPVITTSESGSGELIDSGRQGIILQRADDPNELSRSIAALAADPGFLAELGENAQRLAEANSWEQMSERYEHLYREVTSTA